MQKIKEFVNYSITKGVIISVLIFASFFGITYVWADDNDTIYYACVNNQSGTITMINENKSCSKNEMKIYWNKEGPKGDKGDKGDIGAAGADGPIGPEGPKGDKGDKGETGPTGAVGPAGPQGPKGEKGDKGETGPTGAVGPSGPQGPKGEKGDKGETGPTGTDGQVGPEGPKGEKGDKGETGPTGTDGQVGPEGPKGEKGDKGEMGPPGADGGTLAAFGDGYGGTWSIPAGLTLDLSTPAGYNTLAGSGKAQMQFTDVNISGTLIIPSGINIRATGDVFISGNIIVVPSAQDNGKGYPHPGISKSPASDNIVGGLGLSQFQAAQIMNSPIIAGGAGAGNPTSRGGEGGGALSIFAKGNITLTSGASIRANGNNAVNPTATVDVAGGGGGGGGIVVLASKGFMSISGIISANGGNGAYGINPITPANGVGGGGGGGGGIIHLISSGSPSITGTLQVFGGNAGMDAFGSTINITGGGGGASAGNGGDGGAGFNSNAKSGTPGYILTTIAPSPESILH